MYVHVTEGYLYKQKTNISENGYTYMYSCWYIHVQLLVHTYTCTCVRCITLTQITQCAEKLYMQ